MIRQVITRTNTITGRHYYDEKAIMAWETGNELEDTNADFLHQTSAWIRKWAPHQLVVDGTYKKVNDFALSDPNVDIISNHYYTNANNNHPGQVRKDLEAIGGKKSIWLANLVSSTKKTLTLSCSLLCILRSMACRPRAALSGVFAVIGMMAVFTGTKSIPDTIATICPASRMRESESGDGGCQPGTDCRRTNGWSEQGARFAGTRSTEVTRERFPFAINWMGSPVGRYYDVERAVQPQGPWTRVGKDISDGKNEWDPSKMSLFRDNYRSLTLGQTYYYRVIAKNESGQSAPSNVIRLKHMQKNLPPVITLQDMLSTTVDKGVQLNAAWQDDNLPGPKVSVAWSHDGKNNVHFCNSSKEETRVWFSAPGDYALTFTADDGLLESSKTINVSVKPAVRPVPADYCSFGSGTMDVSKGTLNSIKSEKDTLAIGEDGFLGPFAHDGDSVSWQVSAPGTVNLPYT